MVFCFYYIEKEQDMETRAIPFFMAYPIEKLIQERNQSEKDREYFMQLYPKKSRIVQKLIEEEMALIDRKNCVIYDEYPDRLGLRLIVNAIYEKYEKQQSDEDMFTDKQLIKEMIEILLYQEILKRRQLVKRFYL